MLIYVRYYILKSKTNENGIAIKSDGLLSDPVVTNTPDGDPRRVNIFSIFLRVKTIPLN